jgi:hypothetical protein
MVCLFERFFTDDLTFPPHRPVLTFNAHPRIKVLVYDDSPCLQAIFQVDGVPILKENMIENLNEFYDKTLFDRNLHAFLIEYA